MIAVILTSIVLAFLFVTFVMRKLERTTKRLREFALLDFRGGVDEDDLVSPIKEVSRVSVALYRMRASMMSFSKYVPREVVQFLVQNGWEACLGADRHKMTIFFSDIANFTMISETLALDQLMELLADYLEEMSDILLDEQGMIDKYIGDAIMALFNVPHRVPDHAQRCCRAALRCNARLCELRQQQLARGLPEIRARIGIHTGFALVGNFGARERLNFTAIGDAVNLASRLEGLNKAYGTSIILSEDTHALVREEFLCRPLDTVAVKGKARGVTVYELIAQASDATPSQVAAAQLSTDAFLAYQQRQFERASQLYQMYLEMQPEDISAKEHMRLCAEWLQSPPPPHWSGVRVMHEK